MSTFPPNRWPTATRWEVRHCPSCPNAHILLFDEHDNLRAQMTLSENQLDRFMGGVRDAIATAKRENIERQNRGGSSE